MASTLQEDELAKLLSTLQSARQTQALRARLPDQLTPFASKLTINEPVQDASMSEDDGGGAFRIKKRRIVISVALGSEARDTPEQKTIVLVWKEWSNSVEASSNMDGGANSSIVSVSLEYVDTKKLNEKKSDRTKNDGHAYTRSWSGQSRIYQSREGGIKKVVKELVKDLGFDGDVNELRVLEALLGDDGAQLLNRGLSLTDPTDTDTEMPVLTKIIEDEIKENYNYGDWD